MLKKVLALVLTLSFCLSLLFVNGSFMASAAIIGGFDFGTTSSDSEDSDDFDYETDGTDSEEDESTGNTVQFKFEKCAENSLYELYVIKSGERSGEFYIKNKKTGVCRYSNPQSRDFSESALLDQDKESSQLMLQIYSEESGAIRTINSFRGVSNDGSVNITEKENGFISEYLINGEINISLQISLSDNGFTVESNFSKINTNKENIITNIQILPYFDSSLYGGEGYSLVPDGSGALIYNNTDKNTALPYSQKIYGEDLAFAGMTKTVVTQTAHLPVFGAKSSNGAYLAVIDEGDENALVNATSAYNESMYNTVYSSFDIIAADRVNLGGSSVAGFTSDTEIYDYEHPLTDKIKINYILLDKNDGYPQMAEAYREHIGLKTGKVNQIPSVFLELYGGISKKESFLGIPLTRFKKLTTVSQAKEIFSFFENSLEGEPVISYRSIDSAIISNKIQNKFSLKMGLGSKKNLKELMNLAGGRLYLENDILSAKKSGNGFSKFSDTALRINRNNVRFEDYNFATTGTSNTVKPRFAVKAFELNKIYGKYFKSVNKAGYKTAFINLGNTLYSDFNKDKTVTRKETAEIFGSIIEKNGENGMLYAPNAYAIGYGEYVADTPVYSSNYDLTDADVPFYQMVLSGVKEYSTVSLNLEANTDVTFLKALESGASLKFTFIYDNITSIANTDYEYLFGADFENRKEQALEYQKELEEAFKKLGSRVVENHEILENSLRVTEYQNGSKAVINLTDKDINSKYGRVEAKSYLIVTE